MTTFYLIRHGHTEYSECDKRGFIGQGRNLAPLTELGKEQIKKTSKDSRLKNAQLIVASPFTRALQSASIIATELNLDISVEIDLHEWMPDTTFQYSTSEESFAASESFRINKGIHTDSSHKWEELSHLRERVKRAIEKYLDYDCIIVVCHGMVMRSLKFVEDIENGEIVEYNYPEDQIYEEWKF